MTRLWNWTRRASCALLLGAASTAPAQTLLLDPEALSDAPRVVGSVDDRLLMGPGDTLEVRGPHTERLRPGERYRLVRWQPASRPNTSAPRWVQLVAHARAERVHTQDTAAAWLRIEVASDAVRLGDGVWWWPEDGSTP
jgi:predicted RecB family nuclease